MTFSERFRSLYQHPTATTRELGVSEGKRVADVGAGNGYLTIAAASIVGPSGFVYAVEPDSTRSQRVQERSVSGGFKNVRVLTTTAENLKDIPSDDVDLAFSVFSLHHFSDMIAGTAEIRRILHAGGVFYVWDRVPSIIIRHGTRPEELDQLKTGFRTFELLSRGMSLRARFTK
jgi:ubiquinone/menaquinone biosynthesis C-methylase UbiE